jgi:hypothetical protein
MKTLKDLSYKAIFDSQSKMSERVASVFIYTVIRAGDFIDWLFPVKVTGP